MDVSASFSSDRSGSLEFRFDNEEKLLQHASNRFWFGWGRYGRNRVFDEDTGQDTTVTDGRWIITLGCFGFLGFLAEFGLLVLPIFAAAVVGGLGSPLGAIAGGFVIAFSEVMVTFAWKQVVGYATPGDWVPAGLLQLMTTEYKFAVSFAILIIVLLFRPTGIFKGQSV